MRRISEFAAFYVGLSLIFPEIVCANDSRFHTIFEPVSVLAPSRVSDQDQASNDTLESIRQASETGSESDVDSKFPPEIRLIMKGVDYSFSIDLAGALGQAFNCPSSTPIRHCLVLYDHLGPLTWAREFYFDKAAQRRSLYDWGAANNVRTATFVKDESSYIVLNYLAVKPDQLRRNFDNTVDETSEGAFGIEFAFTDCPLPPKSAIALTPLDDYVDRRLGGASVLVEGSMGRDHSAEREKLRSIISERYPAFVLEGLSVGADVVIGPPGANGDLTRYQPVSVSSSPIAPVFPNSYKQDVIDGLRTLFSNCAVKQK